jgi:hypothetical protein
MGICVEVAVRAQILLQKYGRGLTEGEHVLC